MSTKISLLWEDTLAVLAFAAFALCAATGVLSLEREQSQPPRDDGINIVGRSAILLTHPIDYKATVCQSDYGEQPVCRYYVER